MEVKIGKRPLLLLEPSISVNLFHINPRTIMGREWWDIERKKAFKKAGHVCEACGANWDDRMNETTNKPFLEGHERYKRDLATCIFTYIETVSLCHCCHSYIHQGELLIRKQKGVLDANEYAYMIERGDNILAKMGYNKEKYLREQYSNRTPELDHDYLFFNGKYYNNFNKRGVERLEDAEGYGKRVDSLWKQEYIKKCEEEIGDLKKQELRMKQEIDILELYRDGKITKLEFDKRIKQLQ